MKKYKLLLIVFLLIFIGKSKANSIENSFQKKDTIITMSFADAKELGITDESLSKIYPTRNKLKLKGRKQKKELASRQAKQWVQFWKGFNATLEKDQIGLVVYHKFYLDENGHIIYFLYNINSGELKDSELQNYISALKKYTSKYEFDLSIGMKWSQCGSWKYYED